MTDDDFVTAERLRNLTGLQRPSAQARWLSKRKYKFERRADRNRTIALREAELNRHTVSGSTNEPKRWRVDLSQFGKAS